MKATSVVPTVTVTMLIGKDMNIMATANKVRDSLALYIAACHLYLSETSRIKVHFFCTTFDL